MGKLDHYMECVNKIDDYFEYAYKSRSKEEIKKDVMSYIDDLTKNLQSEILNKANKK